MTTEGDLEKIINIIIECMGETEDVNSEREPNIDFELQGNNNAHEKTCVTNSKDQNESKRIRTKL